MLCDWSTQLITAGNAHAPRCKFQNGGQAKDGKRFYNEYAAFTPVKKANPRKKDKKLYDIEVTEVDKANKKLKIHYNTQIHYIGYALPLNHFAVVFTLVLVLGHSSEKRSF